jgi:hypothetical protein
VLVTDEEPTEYDMVLINVMKVLEEDVCWVSGNQFMVVNLIYNNSLLTDSGTVYVTVTPPGNTLSSPFGPLDPGEYQFVFIGPFTIPDECVDFTILEWVEGQPGDINPANNVMEIYNTAPCVCTDLEQYDDNATVSNGVGFYTYQFGAAYQADRDGFLCAFEAYFTSGGADAPFYFYVWEDTDSDMVPDAMLYTGHYYPLNVPLWVGTDPASCGRYCGPLCVPVVKDRWYWLMLQQKHYADLGLLLYLCIDGDGMSDANSQWEYDGATWVSPWSSGYDADTYLRANFKYNPLPDYWLDCEVTCVSQYVPCINGYLFFDLTITNNGLNTVDPVYAEVYPTLGDCTGYVFTAANWWRNLGWDLDPGESQTGWFYLNTGPDRCSLPQLVALTVDVGDATDHYYGRCCDEFHFYHPWGGRMGNDLTNVNWDGLEWGLRGDLDVIPSVTALGQNYPNPFNANTTIPFDLATEGNVSLQVYNLSGQLVETLVDGYMGAGHHTVDWDASTVASGVYFYKLQVGDYVTTNKMNLLK